MKNKKHYNILVKVLDPRMWFYDFVKWTGCLPVLVSLRTKRVFISKKARKENKGSFIISANHVSYVDPLTICTTFPLRRTVFVGTKELFHSGWKYFFNACGLIEIDKENPSVVTFKKVEKMIAKGHLVCVFPEGSVSRDNMMHTFKTGIVMMAMMSGSDIVPVYISKRSVPKQRQVTIIGEKIHYQEMFKTPFPTMDELRAVASLLTEKEKELEEKYKSMYCKKGE